ncbi:hypothetical protein [Burkholderia vietnamiensis]|uniref:hypothetical protein n=1 Tax=Burkholderia vietnamiensis TaxID=60552 RepID=UPI002654393E|nr:hypothetical protein [Burkholderia vietnamiensis]MDN7820704.1 hypothetical protein [Burkholderia vietnamiensis]
MLYLIALTSFACGVLIGRALRRPNVRVAVGDVSIEARTCGEALKALRFVTLVGLPPPPRARQKPSVPDPQRVI